MKATHRVNQWTIAANADKIADWAFLAPAYDTQSGSATNVATAKDTVTCIAGVQCKVPCVFGGT